MGGVTPHRIFTAKIMHKRLVPRVNQFIYGQYYVFLALSRLSSKSSPFFSLNRFNLFSFYEKDYGPCDGSNLYKWCQKTLKAHNLKVDWLNEIHLITQPRLLGWVFNPVSFWLCEDENQDIRVALAEVHNTFGERHTYLIHHEDLRPISGDDEIKGTKLLYVSPFFDVEGEYAFRFKKTTKNFGVWIDYYVEDEKRLLTSLTGNIKKLLSTQALLSLFCKIPLANLKTFSLIHYQAIKLWLKKIKLTHRDPFTGPKASVCSKERSNKN